MSLSSSYHFIVEKFKELPYTDFMLVLNKWSSHDLFKGKVMHCFTTYKKLLVTCGSSQVCEIICAVNLYCVGSTSSSAHPGPGTSDCLYACCCPSTRAKTDAWRAPLPSNPEHVPRPCRQDHWHAAGDRQLRITAHVGVQGVSQSKGMVTEHQLESCIFYNKSFVLLPVCNGPKIRAVFTQNGILRVIHGKHCNTSFTIFIGQHNPMCQKT